MEYRGVLLKKDVKLTTKSEESRIKNVSRKRGMRKHKLIEHRHRKDNISKTKDTMLHHGKDTQQPSQQTSTQRKQRRKKKKKAIGKEDAMQRGVPKRVG